MYMFFTEEVWTVLAWRRREEVWPYRRQNYRYRNDFWLLYKDFRNYKSKPLKNIVNNDFATVYVPPWHILNDNISLKSKRKK